MASFYCLADGDLQELLKELPIDQGIKLKERLSSVLDYLVWTELDAKNALQSVLDRRNTKPSSQEFEELLSQFLCDSFECDATTERVNDYLYELARNFLDGHPAFIGCTTVPELEESRD